MDSYMAEKDVFMAAFQAVRGHTAVKLSDAGRY